MATPLAIVGMSAEFPSGNAHKTNLDHSTFFDFLLNKGQAYEIFPPNRFNIEAWKGTYAGQVITDTGAFLKDVSLFDHLEFGITAMDAKNMSLSTRKLIEHSFLALLDSGIDYRGRNVGSFASGVSHDLTEPDEMDARGSFAGIPSMIANKISYHLDLRGPSIPTDTACSSSLTALHLAVQSIRSGDCEAAVVGGCQLNYRLLDFIQYSQGGILSPDGKCKPFDSSANGFGRGEGVCVIVIKPLDDAIRDGDPVYATILGTGVNCSGGVAPVSAPVASAQEDAMRRAYLASGRRPSEVDFVELHATGTAAGDPTEANWVGKAFEREDGSELLIGSVKGNIGHLEISAFLASLSKVCSIMRTGLVPPNVNINEPNPAIHWDKYKLRVPTEPTTIKARGSSGKLLVSIPGSGVGGVNGHVVLEGPPRRNAACTGIADHENDPILVCVGGLSPRSAAYIANDVLDLIANGNFSNTIAALYGRRCRQMTWRTFIVFDHCNVSRVPRFPDPVLTPRSKPPLVFVFSGQGPQHLHMGRHLYRKYPVFQDVINQLDSVHQRVTGKSLLKDFGLFDEHTSSGSFLPEIWPIAITLPAICMIQIALVELLQSFGLRPDAVVGHSAGEAAMLYACGSTERDLALEISIARGIAMTRLEDESNGAMAAINCSLEKAEAIRDKVSSTKVETEVIDIACYNSNSAYVFSGTKSLIEKVVEMGKSQGLFTRLIRTRTPVHSGLMEICKLDYQRLLTDAYMRYSNPSSTFHPKIATYSCLSGKRWSRTFTPNDVWDSARGAVLFSQSVNSILHDMPTACFFEISAHPILTSYITDLVGEGSNSVLSSLKRAKDSEPGPVETINLLSSLGKLESLGYNLLLPSILGCGNPDAETRVPSYPFAKKEVQYASQSSRTVARQMKHSEPLYDSSGDLRLNSLTHPDVAQHVIRGEAIMPVAGYLEMAFESGAREVWDVEFRSIMPFQRDSYLSVSFLRSGPYWKVVSSPGAQHPTMKEPRLHAEGYMSITEVGNSHTQPIISPFEVMDRCRKINIYRFYENLRYFANYGPIFQRLLSCYINDTEALVELKAFDDDISNFHRYLIHPVILDSCFHVMESPSFTRNANRFGYYLSAGVKKVMLLRPNYFQDNAPRTIYSYARLVSWDPINIYYDISVLDVNGAAICQIYGYRVTWHDFEQNQLSRNGYTLTYIPLELHQQGNGTLGNVQTIPTIISFQRDGFLHIYRSIAELIKSDSPRLWIEATIGPDGYAAQGFFRALSRELLGIELFLAIFHDSWGEEERKSIIQNISGQVMSDHEIMVDAKGTITCPRILPFSTQVFDDGNLRTEDVWAWNSQKDTLVIYKNLPPCGTGESLVHFINVTSTTAGGYRGFLGTLIRSSTDGVQSRATVAGIVPSHIIANYGVIQDGHLISVSEELKNVYHFILPVLSICFAGGSRLIENPTGCRIIYVRSEDDMDDLAIHVLRSLGIAFVDISHSRLQSLSSEVSSGGALLSAIKDQDITQAIQRICRGRLPTFLFNDEYNGLHRMVNADPLGVNQTLEKILSLFPSLPVFEGNVGVDSKSLIPQLPLVSIHRELFDGAKSYILVGGIGSIGFQVALWMYQNGARHLILTSRRGPTSLQDRKDLMSQRILQYLYECPDLHLTLKACDATSQEQVAEMIEMVQKPIAGCILLSVVLSDRLFMSHTPETYYVPFPPKLGAFEVLSKAINISSLDFLVSFSSAAVFGTPGQTNYASANTQLQGVLSRYRNAFSLVCPPIINSITISHGDAMLPDPRYHKYLPWAMSSQQICEFLGDGIRRLTMESFTTYIPELDWLQVQKHLGKSSLYDSLVGAPASSDSADMMSFDPTKSLGDIVAKYLDMDVNDLASNVPFTSFGLDSLSAGRLAFSLKPVVSVTQLQLLGDMTLEGLQKLAVESRCPDGEQSSTAVKHGFDWHNLNRPGETVVKLVDGDDNPLILVHGGSGIIVPFIPLQERFATAVWALQSTPDAPRHSIRDVAAHYFAKIKENRPIGPYRIAGYCSGSIIAFEIVRLLEQNRDHISQFVILDHFPALFLSPLFPLDDESLESGVATNVLADSTFQILENCYIRDPENGRMKFATEFINARKGMKVRPLLQYTNEYFRDHVSACVKFLLDIGGPGLLSASSKLQHIQEKMMDWLRELSTPVTVVVATRGLGAELTDPEWQALGAKRFISDVDVVEVPYGHFDMFESEEVVALLENMHGICNRQ